MDFELTAEQVALREMARDVFARLYGPPRLRELWDGGARDAKAWRVMAEQGLVGLAVPADHGGMGGDAIDLLVVLTEAGRAGVPDPLLETAAVAAPLLAGTPLGSEWLPRLAAGDAVVTVAGAGQPYAPDADVADLLLYTDGDQVVATETFGWEQVASEDRSRRLFRVTPDGGVALAPAARAHALGAFASAAALNGVSDRLLDMTLEHAKVRYQFDQPIGAFQAVKHKLASVYAELQSAHAAARYAAYSEAVGAPDRALAASVAKVAACAAGALANTEALQCFGGIGFTWEHDLHFWLKRGRALEHTFGSARAHRAALAAAVLDG